MPRIADEHLESVFYLYPDYAAAEAGIQAGGCGFFLNWPFERDTQNHLYAVTNKHLITQGNWTLRVNVGADKAIPVDTTEPYWFVHPDGDDLAVMLVEFPFTFTCKAVKPEILLTPEIVREHAIGIGEDVYTVGRFVNHDGKQKNNPVARFGTIAQMPIEPILQQDGHLQESFLCECKSVSGYSGSSVFVDIPPWSRRPGKAGISSVPGGVWLMGVNWGHLNDWKPVCDPVGRPMATPSMKVGLNSGMMGVVPAWKLKEMLEHPALINQRRRREENVLGKGPPIASSDSASGVQTAAVQVEPDDANPDHLEDFTALLGAAAKAQSPKGQT